ncbi:MAG: hypothetical protein U0996_23510 [Planctomycetaceae bacterium]
MAEDNQKPNGAGDITTYTPVPESDSIFSEYCLRSATVEFPTATNAEILFVNGMNNSPESHRRAALQLATITGQNVVGIYNQTGITGNENIPNAIIDALQCVHDQLLPVGRAGDALAGLAAFQNPAGALSLLLARLSAGRFTPLRQAERLAGEAVLSLNRASVALYNRLYDNANKRQRTIVVCHSQGNLISANAIWVLKRARHWAKPVIGKVRLFGLASPTMSWPPNNEDGFKFSLYRDDRDLVTMLSIPGIGKKPFTHGGPGWDSSTHAIGNYFALQRFQEDLARNLKRR